LKNFLGVSEQDEHIFLDFIKTIYLLDKMKPGDPKPAAFLKAWESCGEYCQLMVARAKRDKTQDAFGLIVQAQAGGTLSDAEMLTMMLLLFIGGQPTTAAMGSAALYRLAQNPDVLEKSRQDLATAKRHCEESLRLDPPVLSAMRFATENVQMGGKVIQKGMPVYVMLAVACRDPAQFPDPDRYDIGRKNLQHLSFGHGLHSCIGNTIARASVPLLLQGFAQKFPRLRVDDSRSKSFKVTARSRHYDFLPLLA
jgi:cytochrome P450